MPRASRSDAITTWQRQAILLWNDRPVTHPVRVGPRRVAMEEALARRHRALAHGEMQQRLGFSHFVWLTQGASKVRGPHRALQGQVFASTDLPDAGPPGWEHNCRCTSMPVPRDAGEAELMLANLTLPRGGPNPASWIIVPFVQWLLDEYWPETGGAPESRPSTRPPVEAADVDTTNRAARRRLIQRSRPIRRRRARLPGSRETIRTGSPIT